jgi:hypothetical protein
MRLDQRCSLTFAKPPEGGITNNLARRSFFGHVAGGIYGAALASLLGQDLYGDERPNARGSFDLKPKNPHFEPKARAVIHLYMNGGPSQMDLFDPKPMLDKLHGTQHFKEIAGEIENVKDAGSIMRCPYKFAQHGQSGMWVSDVMPHLAKQVDDIALVRSLFTTNLTHEPAIYLMQTGKMGPGRPSLGSWAVFGLGSENQNLPAYVVLDDPLGLPINGVENWQSGFLPPLYQGTRFKATGSPVLNLQPDVERPAEIVAMERDLLARLDAAHKGKRPGNPKLDARIASYELAARMQLAATDALDLSKETQATLDMYGIGKPVTESYGRRCLIARRLIERGVRFVQLYINAQIWDNHTNLAGELKSACERTDQPIGGLLQDLKQRGLMDSTLVIWGGEFGRLPIAQLPKDKNEKNAGRDHNKNAACTWFAGASIKGGTIHGATDDLGFAAVDGKVSVPDWHATILHLLGLDHEHLFIELNGLRERLTGVNPARVVREILA